jgi:glyoxylase-like metal-dependent hydrolase (beta-lactamase superfamily II)
VAGARVHHLNCGTMCPYGRRFINGDGSPLEKGRIICHVLLIEGANGLTLVDTGFGVDDVQNARHMDRAFKLLTFPQLELGETAMSQVRELGFDPADVRNIVLTHLDIDHSGGLPDFPKAQVHAWATELQTMRNPPLRERKRYSISRSHWAHGPDWVEHAEAGDDWFGFESVRVLPDSGAEMLLIPLPGHTFGHTAVAVREDERWLMHCGDAYFHHGDIETPRRCPPGLRAFQSLVQANSKLRHQNQERLRELARKHSDEVSLICAHDVVEFEREAR